MSTTIAMIGVGQVGANLGRRLAEHDFDVLFGIRKGKDAKGKDVEDLLASCGGRAKALPVKDAAEQADVIFLALPAGAAVDSLEGAAVSGKVVVDCTNPLTWDDGPVWAPPAEGSVTAALAATYPEAHHVKAFNTFGAELHRDPALAGGHTCDLPMAGDDPAAKQAVDKIGTAIGFAPVDAGPLRNAATLENLAVLWIHLALQSGLGREFAFKIIDRA